MAGGFVTLNNHRTQNKVSVYDLQALEASHILVFDVAKIVTLFGQNKQLINLSTKIKTREKKRLFQHDQTILKASLESKYAAFIEAYPQLTRRVSHVHIASYLGISPVTLNRVRGKVK